MKNYEVIYQALERGILKDIYEAGTYLPSENKLRQTYHVSRDTIRKALALLMANGYIQKIQGKGSLVLKREQLRFPVSGLTSYKELQNSYGYESSTVVVSLRKITIDQETAHLTGFEVGAVCWELIRTRAIDQKKVILDKDLLSTVIVPELDTEIAKDSIYRYFENQLEINISFAEKEITIDALTDEDRELLDLNQHDINIVSVKSRVFTSDARQFQYTESRHQVDKFRFFDFARRHPSTM
ncbi:trehalose operon repressor [Enterococcus xiangfangensis]|uniref:Trehalose operon repressor n=1 Tax=Enterococcus xiangfangensis TaxID=1296537 RepID=A0ABU3FAI8_9ENTE|nr:trehalose operon repressor [Enterococcus xiangfangensis]MBM7712611.1 GntR family trehalose operon transcriptional repressor [Enterococcus xiangfangensis]MDT2759679.1 trehalose operon repressor [Enterococcus xiangfangensis]NBK08668.1 trehalose operon repressor [Enterococcus asini]